MTTGFLAVQIKKLKSEIETACRFAKDFLQLATVPNPNWMFARPVPRLPHWTPVYCQRGCFFSPDLTLTHESGHPCPAFGQQSYLRNLALCRTYLEKPQVTF